MQIEFKKTLNIDKNFFIGKYTCIKYLNSSNKIFNEVLIIEPFLKKKNYFELNNNLAKKHLYGWHFIDLKLGIYNLTEGYSVLWGPRNWATQIYGLDPITFMQGNLEKGTYFIWPCELKGYFYIQKITRCLNVYYPTVVDKTAEPKDRFLYSKYSYVTIDNKHCIKVKTKKLKKYFKREVIFDL